MNQFDTSITFPNGVTLKNRLVMSPMTTLQSYYEGTVTQDEIDYYTRRAKGLGAIITGAANVEPLGKGWQGELSVAEDDKIAQLSKLAHSIQSQGSKAILQIFHAGRMTFPATLSGEQPVSASAVPAEHRDPNTHAAVPRSMTNAEVYATIAAFGDATHRAIQAGFDGVELHGANTYLLQQFFSPHSNRRTDEFGGSIDKRYTFIEKTLESVFAAVDQYADRPFIVGYRFSPEEFTNPGITFEDTGYLVNKLVQTKLDYLHVSLDNYKRVSIADNYKNQTILEYLHRMIDNKKPLIGVGGVRTREDVQNVLGSADLVAVGQQMLVDPDWPLKLANNADDAMINDEFKDAIEYTPLNAPLYDFLVERYGSIPNI